MQMNQMSSKRSHTQPIAKRSIAFTFYHNKVKEEDYGVCADCLGLSAESKPMVKQTSEIIQKSLPMFGIVG